MRLRRASAIAALYVLASAATARAEGAWVLWSRIADPTKDDQWLDWTSGGSAFPTYDKCRGKIREYTRVPEENSLADWFDWARGTGRYYKNGGVYVTESGVLLVNPKDPRLRPASWARIASEWRCLPDTMDPRGPKGEVSHSALGAMLAAAALVAGCASAGGTAGIFDSGSVWYKHPTTGDVRECGGGFYPGVQIRRRSCGNRYIAAGYTEVEKCKVARPGALCVTDAEIERSEKSESTTAADRLRELKALHDQHLITDEEYEAKRQQILDRL